MERMLETITAGMAALVVLFAFGGFAIVWRMVAG